MKIENLFKQFSIVALVISVAIGCASEPEVPAGPSPEQLASEAIAAAQAAIDEATALGADTTEADRLLSDARAAYDSGDYPAATDLANQAERAARDAIDRYNAEQMAVVEPAEPESTNYEVRSGDSLWSIAGSSAAYGNPYAWPYIYKTNKGQIKDADLIYPGQVFEVMSSPSDGDLEAAINHARNRGAWSIGTVEASDEAYLAQ